MYLLNTETLKLEEFYADIPPYAILSHTWGEGEVTFQDIQNPEVAQHKAGWNKITSACSHAKKYQFEWIWIDSCCIDKRSSAELSEAINSMYQYYSDAKVCYVYLSDVLEKEDPRDPKSAFRRSRWFTRGWTLQELLAPTYVVFLHNNWTEIGTRWSLRDAISAITAIPRRVFEDGDIANYSIAQKMSWAAWRQTTRPEDQAYCLMGLFGVNLPPIYGEGGPKAFMRLQQEIIKISNDRSIFAWVAPDGSMESRGLLAQSPYEFRASGEVQSSEVFGINSSFSFNNNGLRIHVPLVPFEPDLFLASLQCQSERDESFVSVYLIKTKYGDYIRCRPSELLLNTSPPLETLEEISVRENLFPTPSKPHGQLRYALPPLVGQHCRYIAAESRSQSRRRSLSATATRTMSTRRRISEFYTYKTDSGEGLLITTLGFQDRDTSNHFAFRLFTEATSPTMLEFSSNTRDIFEYLMKANQWVGGRADRILAPLKDSGMMAVLSVHPAGKMKNLEVSCLRDMSLGSKLIEYSRQGFLVPTSIYSMNISSPFVLTSVFPADYLQNQLDDKSYVSIPDTDEADTKSFRIITYEASLPSASGSHKAFVAVGFHENSLWTDAVTFKPHQKSPGAEKIWNSYLDGGLRAQVRLDYRDSISINITQSSALFVKAEKRKNLQVGTHFLSIELKERQNGQDVIMD
ncbi:hypothetical protein VKT23_011158 [Stygiomarasmius scandens]|uniref:Heterokaryon incompatibility domain-containing protein n=1 Tax=Marasmiellus scandens TaxID=2682957 RepID=A0ABR1JE51_9AGAR